MVRPRTNVWRTAGAAGPPHSQDRWRSSDVRHRARVIRGRPEPRVGQRARQHEKRA